MRFSIHPEIFERFPGLRIPVAEAVLAGFTAGLRKYFGIEPLLLAITDEQHPRASW